MQEPVFPKTLNDNPIPSLLATYLLVTAVVNLESEMRRLALALASKFIISVSHQARGCQWYYQNDLFHRNPLNINACAPMSLAHISSTATQSWRYVAWQLTPIFTYTFRSLPVDWMKLLLLFFPSLEPTTICVVAVIFPCPSVLPSFSCFVTLFSESLTEIEQALHDCRRSSGLFSNDSTCRPENSTFIPELVEEKVRAFVHDYGSAEAIRICIKGMFVVGKRTRPWGCECHPPSCREESSYWAAPEIKWWIFVWVLKQRNV